MKIEDRAHLRRETRTVTVDLEVRDAADGGLTFEGYATTYGVPYDVQDFLGTYQEEFAHGSFSRSLGQKPDVPLLVNHAGLPLARTTSGTLDVWENKTGLRARATLEPQDPDVAGIRFKMQRGDLNKMSLAFRVTNGGQEWSPDYSFRRITEAQLFDVSIVTTPANPNTSASLRNLDIAELDPDDLVILVARYMKIDEPAARALLVPVVEEVRSEDDGLPTIEELLLRHYQRKLDHVGL